MNLQFHSVHFTADQKLKDVVTGKIGKLQTFYDPIISGEVFFRLEANQENPRENKQVEIKLHVPGETLFAKQQSHAFEAAADAAAESLRRQLLKVKAKQKAG